MIRYGNRYREASTVKNDATCMAKDVAPSVRTRLVDIFGRELSDGERLRIPLVGVDDAKIASEDVRETAWESIRRILDRAAANSASVSDDDFDAAVDEAMASVRPRLS
jgi:hypothetical protein